MTPREPEGERGLVGSVDYDLEERWLVFTERVGPDEFGAAEVIAEKVSPWFGLRVEAAFRLLAESLDRIEAVEALPVHEISGAEWECYEQDTGCHYHWSGKACEYGHPFGHEGNYDRDGQPCDHRALLDRNRVLALLKDPHSTPPRTP